MGEHKLRVIGNGALGRRYWHGKERKRERTKLRRQSLVTFNIHIIFLELSNTAKEVEWTLICMAEERTMRFLMYFGRIILRQ
jgi:hypothetical protein